MSAALDWADWHVIDAGERAARIARVRCLGPQVCRHPAWPAMVEAGARYEVRPLFAPDLYVHDRRALTGRDASEPYLWAVGEAGTYLQWIHAGRPMQAHAARDRVTLLESGWGALHVWDGRELRPVDADTAVAILSGEVTLARLLGASP